MRTSWIFVAVSVFLASLWSSPPARAASRVIYASGQLLVPGDPAIPPGQPGHDDSRENYVYAIDAATGVATPVSPVTSGLPSALAGTRDQRLLGFKSGQLYRVEPSTGAQTPVGESNGLNSTSLEILPDGRGFLTPFNGDFATQQLFSIDIETGVATAISASPTEIGHAIDAAAGNALGTAEPFVISLGAVGQTLYGVDLDTLSLISLEATTGTASVVGPVGAVGAVGGGAYSGFAALTGVDEDADGVFDALLGAVNFFDDGTELQRLGGVARYDLATGAWSLVGTNPGVIFFGFGSSPVPEPGTGGLALLGASLIARRRRVARACNKSAFLAAVCIPAICLVSVGQVSAATVAFDFEDQESTGFNAGALTSLTLADATLTVTITRPGDPSQFDIYDVNEIGNPTLPSEWGQRSLNPWFSNSGTAFVADFSRPIKSASIAMGDFGGDPDDLLMEAYSEPGAHGALLASSTVQLAAGGSDFTQARLTVATDSALIRSIRFMGGADAYETPFGVFSVPNSVYYDNFSVVVPEPHAVLVALGLLLPFVSGRSVNRP